MKKTLKLWQQKIGLWSQVFGVLITIGIAIYAIWLTKELSRTDESVANLEKLVQKADTTNQDILTLIKEIQKSQSQNDTMIGKLSNHSSILNSQLLLLSKQFALYKNNTLSENQKILLEYNNMIDRFRECVYLKFIFPKEEVLNYPKNKRVEIISELSKDIEDIFMSPITYTNSQNLNVWINFKFEFIMFKDHMVFYPPIDSIENSKVGNNAKEDFINAFDRFEGKFEELENIIGDFPDYWQNKKLN